MKRLIYFACLSFVCVESARATTPDPGVFGRGQWKDEAYAVKPASTHISSGRWDPEKGITPLSVPDAVSKARDGLRKMVGNDHVRFECDEIKLSRSGGMWFYVIVFFSRDPKIITKGSVGVFPAILPFIVYLDGVVEFPHKTKL
jgi:hypothetical protein